MCCGFGAIVLLLVLTKIGEPGAIEQARVDLDGLIARLEEELFEIRGETVVLDRDSRGGGSSCRPRPSSSLDCAGTCDAARRVSRPPTAVEVDDIRRGRLLAAQQALTEEMRRLQEQN